jgi:hypothetical protein
MLADVESAEQSPRSAARISRAALFVNVTAINPYAEKPSCR